MTTYVCDLALVGGHVEADVAITVINGVFTTVEVSGQSPQGATHLKGLTLPGMANAHSHAFHRALRSRTHAARGSFWTWRELMYEAASRLDPDNYFRLARATFAEMARAGITCVGEFHYIHHRADGGHYDDPNAMGMAVLSAARDAGIRITLLDTLYLHGDLDHDGYAAPSARQRRYSDDTAAAWIDRVDDLSPASDQRIGAAIHSVRAVDPASLRAVAEATDERGWVVHAHVSEQRAENAQCLAEHGCTPTVLLEDTGLLGPRFTAVHGTHLTPEDITLLEQAGAYVCMCPTTERDLGDGIGPTATLAAHDIPISLGSDSHAVIDHFEECRALELNERLRVEQRGIHSASELFEMATTNGHVGLGWNDAGAIEQGRRADLVTLGFDSVRLSGVPRDSALQAAVFAATTDDVSHVLIDGRSVIEDHQHTTIDIPSELSTTVHELMGS
jgi:formiminoglutamate deiminase